MWDSSGPEYYYPESFHGFRDNCSCHILSFKEALINLSFVIPAGPVPDLTR
jgi:hypothetical protein